MALFPSGPWHVRHKYVTWAWSTRCPTPAPSSPHRVQMSKAPLPLDRAVLCLVWGLTNGVQAQNPILEQVTLNPGGSTGSYAASSLQGPERVFSVTASASNHDDSLSLPRLPPRCESGCGPSPRPLGPYPDFTQFECPAIFHSLRPSSNFFGIQSHFLWFAPQNPGRGPTRQNPDLLLPLP